jgi:hypothetical protein
VFPFFGQFRYSNLKHDPIRFDLSRFAFDFIDADNKPMLMVALPLLQQFKVNFDYEYSGWVGAINSQGKIQLDAKNALAMATMTLDATENGHLYP